MTTHELEQFIERAWNDPAHPPAEIPAEVTRYALERGRRARSCELKRVLGALAAWVRGGRLPARAPVESSRRRSMAARPC